MMGWETSSRARHPVSVRDSRPDCLSVEVAELRVGRVA